MIAADRHNFHRAPWTSATNLFSLMFALLLALAIVVLLLLYFDLMQRQPCRGTAIYNDCFHRDLSPYCIKAR